MAKKVMVMVTCGSENPERATIGFGMAFMAIQNPEVEAVSIGLQSNGVWLAKAGMIEHVEAEGMPPLQQMFQGFLQAGGKIYVCAPCAEVRKLNDENIAEGMEIVEAQQLVAEMLAADTAMTY